MHASTTLDILQLLIQELLSQGFIYLDTWVPDWVILVTSK